MSGIAEVLLTLGYSVSGSDTKPSTITERLQNLGATVYEGHKGANVEGAHVVVTSSAVRADNPEVVDVRAFDVGAFVDRKSTRLNSSHVAISYAVFCLKKKKH